jgi:hypothetical protein
MPRNRASNPTQMISNAARSRTSCWEAQKPMGADRGSALPVVPVLPLIDAHRSSKPGNPKS